MSLLVRGSRASADPVSLLHASQISGNLYTGEAIDPCAPCYIKASDGRVYMSNGTAANEASKCHGFSARKYSAGEAITLLGSGTRYGYGAGLAIGTKLFIGTTAGRLDDTATVGDAIGVAFVSSATDIIFANFKL